jgi:hypothetical protein
MSNILYSGTAVNNKFQAYNAGNVSGYTPVATGIQSGGVDINSPTPLFSPRDNKTGNAATSTGAINSNSKDLTLLFNKIGATYDVTISGTAVATGSIITPNLVYSGQSPTTNGTNAPTFSVPQPTVDTGNTTCLAVGTYTFNNSLISSTVLGGVIVIKLPGNYQFGTISGSFTVTSSGPLAVGSMVSGSGSIPVFPDPATPANTTGTVTGGYPPYTISWVRFSGVYCNVTSQSGNPTSTASWTTSSTTTGFSGVRMSVTDSATPTPGTASNTTTINWSAV